jgi:hypothetical protein
MENQNILIKSSTRLENALKFRDIVKLILELPDKEATIWIIENLRDKNYMIKKKYEQKTDDYCVIYHKLFRVLPKDIETMVLYIRRETEKMFMRSSGLKEIKKIDWKNKRDLMGSFAMLSNFIDDFKRLNEATMLLLEIKCSNIVYKK